MRLWWILPVLGAWTLAVAARGDEGNQPSGAAKTQDGQDSPSLLEPTEFQPRQPLGALQPTDIGEPAKEEPNPAPPAALSPEPDAAPMRGAGQSFQFNDLSQPVAPAQFQSPVTPKAVPNPKTTVVPAASAPALQAVPPTAQPSAAAEPQNLAQSLYQQSLAPPASGAIQGAAVGLQQALTQRTDPTRYAEFVKSYWKLSHSLAVYHDALQSAAELARLTPPRVPYQQALLQAGGAAAEAEVRQARLQAISAQWELSDQMTAVATPPLPQDTPLISAYKSKFEAVFAGRLPPAGAQKLHATFDPRLAVIEGRASAVVAAENAFGALAEAYANGQLDMADVLREHARLQTARREFLGSVYDYNAAIADYAWLAAGPNRSPDTISSMLVERKKLAAAPEAATANFVAPQ